MDVLLDVPDVQELVLENVKEAVLHLVILDVMVDVKDVLDPALEDAQEDVTADALAADHAVVDVVLVVDVRLLVSQHVPLTALDVNLEVLRTVLE